MLYTTNQTIAGKLTWLNNKEIGPLDKSNVTDFLRIQFYLQTLKTGEKTGEHVTEYEY